MAMKKPKPNQITVTGDNGDNTLNGTAGDDLLQGLGGNDILNGLGGIDRTEGGLGDDWHYVDNALDVVIELPNQGWDNHGSDRVLTSVSYVLPAAASVEKFTTTDVSGTDAINLTGNDFQQEIHGNNGNNIIEARDIGYRDWLYGYGGDDTYYVTAGDLVYEAAGQGYDRVYTTHQFIVGSQEIEFLSVININAEINAVLEGGTATQEIHGDLGSNRITGHHHLYGYAGNDYYTVYETSIIHEDEPDGFERVTAMSNWVANAEAAIEQITIGSSAFDTVVTGNGYEQTIYGSGYRNILDGGGGNDILYGYGNHAPRPGSLVGDDDWFYVDAGDTVIELANEGNDRVLARTSYTLDGACSVEQLTTANDSGTTAIDLTGNEVAQLVRGNGGANVIDGKGGSDALYGLGGADSFFFSTVLGPENIDTIHDYAVGTDRILLGNGIFGGLAVGALAAGAFRAGSAAVDADDRILHDSATGALYFDRDGNGATFGAVQFAFVSAGLILSASDFNVVQGVGGAPPNVITGDGGDNTLNGTAGNDLLQGLGGNDVLIGGAGFDQTQGGTGNDWHYVDNADDIVEELAGEGNDRVLTQTSYALGAGVSAEKLTTTSNLGGAAINLTGNELAQEIYGNSGNNILDGKGGADILYGLLGNDTYYVDHAGDRVYELAGEGNDQLFTSLSFTLAAGMSVEAIRALSTSGTDPLNLTGNEVAQQIDGNDGNNILDGKGGADTLYGFAGDDWYVVDNALDQVHDTAGTDRVFASASFSLTSSTGTIEKLTTLEVAGTQAIDLTGNGGTQEIYGNFGNNRLDDGGGTSPDYLFGLLGNDTYVISSSAGGDTSRTLSQVYEQASGGTDEVIAGRTWLATAGSEIEIIRLAAGSQNYDLTGNSFGQSIHGNAGMNILDGGGGDDMLYGGANNDQYFVEAGDRIFELTGEGSDRVWARTSYTLEAGSAIEQLTTSRHNGTEAIDLTGNELVQAIYGNAGANVIDGKAGNDILYGLAGADGFAFTTALGAGNVDAIADYEAGVDKIQLDDAIFTGLATGALASGAFVTGTAAADADDRIVFDGATGRIWFDADGNGAGAAVHFATITNGAILTASDFTVI